MSSSAIGRFRGPETSALHLLIITDCPSYTAVYRQRSGLSCCRCPYLEQSASTRHVCTLYVCFPRTLEGFPRQAFFSLTRYCNFCSACAVTIVIFGHFNRSFYLLTYLLTYLLLHCILSASQDRSRPEQTVVAVYRDSSLGTETCCQTKPYCTAIAFSPCVKPFNVRLCESQRNQRW